MKRKVEMGLNIINKIMVGFKMLKIQKAYFSGQQSSWFLDGFK